MKQLFTPRSMFSLALLIVAASTLVASVKASVDGMAEAAFLSVAIFATILAYILGFTKMIARHAWAVIIWLGFLFTFLATTRIASVLWQTVLHLPNLPLSVFLAWLTKQPLDTSFFQVQLDEILDLLTVFAMELFPREGGTSLILREILWDIPILLLCAWAAWWSSRRNLVLTALIPLIGLQAFILNYTDKRTLSLQIAVFAFVFLLGIHQKWSLPQSTGKTQSTVRRETYSIVFILAFLLAIAAGWTPVLSVEDIAEKIEEQQEVNETLGLQNEITESTSNGLPQEHLLNAPEEDLMAIVFTANTGEPLAFENEQPIIPHHYWRWLTYDLYNGKTWSTSHITNMDYPADQALFEFSPERTRVIHQTIKKTSPNDGHLYWINTLIRANQPFSSMWRVLPTPQDPLLHMDMLGSLIQSQEYSTDSLIKEISQLELREASNEYPQEIRDKYLPLPANISQRVLDLSAQITTPHQNAYDKATAIEDYLRTYPYTLDVPPVPEGREIADYFLFDLKTGYCDYYSTSMVVLARAAGLPARLVIGYSSKDYDLATGEYLIRRMNAHSWVEIYFPNIGWVEFEPTANQAKIERPPTPPEPETPEEAPKPEIKSREGIKYEKHGWFVEKNYLLPVSILAGIILIVFLWYLRLQGLRLTYKNISAMYRHVYYHGKKIRRETGTNETPSLFAENLKAKLRLDRRFLLPAAGEIDQLTSLYLQETYSPHPITRQERIQAIKRWRRLVWRLLYARMITRSIR